MTATTFHRVRSSHPEDDALGRVFGPGELVPNLDTDDPFNERKIEEGIFYPVEEEDTEEFAQASAAANPPEVTDAAQRLATDNSIDLATVTGTGKGGRIVEDDVQKIVDANAAQAAADEEEGGD